MTDRKSRVFSSFFVVLAAIELTDVDIDHRGLVYASDRSGESWMGQGETYVGTGLLCSSPPASKNVLAHRRNRELVACKIKNRAHE